MTTPPIVVCFASVDWAFNRQIPQEVAAGFAAAGHRVLYIENTGVRTIGWHDASRLAHRLLNWWRARRGSRTTADGVELLSPLLLPFPYAPSAIRLNAAWLERRVRAWLEAQPTGAPIIYVTFLPTPLSAALGAALRPAVQVYYCCDDFVQSSPGARAIGPHEAALEARADLVLTTSAVLQRAARARSSRAVLLPCGVRCRPFEAAADAVRLDPASVPAPLRGLRWPIAGLIGSVRDAIDLELVASAARLAPDVTFVLAGPVMADIGALRACRNVIFGGAMTHETIVRWVAAFDVGLAPYVRTPFTEALMPAKLKEYLAAGLPVVATGLPELRRFDARHPAMLRFAATPATFVAAIREAARDVSPEAVRARRAVARQYDWTRQIASLRALVDEALHERPRAVAR
jgi:glycosyltransferase involved in cell wall biosynthesis